MKPEVLESKVRQVKEYAKTISAKDAIAKAGLTPWQYYRFCRKKRKPIKQKIAPNRDRKSRLTVTEISLPSEVNVFAFYGPKEELAKIIGLVR